MQYTVRYVNKIKDTHLEKFGLLRKHTTCNFTQKRKKMIKYYKNLKRKLILKI